LKRTNQRTKFNFPKKESFDYIPGESVIVQPSEKMIIDFPEAKKEDPTQCLALAISKEKINQTLDYLNERFPREQELNGWGVNNNFFHLHNNPSLTSVIDRMVQISIYEKSTTKDMFADLTLQELLLRLMQTQARSFIEKQSKTLASYNRFAFVSEYIQMHINEKIDVERLADKACMSTPHFYRKFKEYFGLTPIEYIQQVKINKAKELLVDFNATVNSVSYALGYQNMNHFIRIFKQLEGVTPKKYQLHQIKSNLNFK
jgi:AraC-like DNA-binding protein